MKWTKKRRREGWKQKKNQNKPGSGFWLGIKANFSEGKKETCFKFWLDVWKPEVTVFPVQMLPDIYVRSLDPLHFSVHRLLRARCPLSRFLSWNISQALVYCREQSDTETAMDISQSQRHNHWNQMERNLQNDSSCEAPKLLRLVSQSIWVAPATNGCAGAKTSFWIIPVQGAGLGGNWRAARDQSSGPCLCLWPCLEGAAEGAHSSFDSLSFSKYIPEAARAL